MLDHDLTAQLEEEGEVAADYLEGFLDIVDLDGDIELDVKNNRAAVAVVGDPEELRRLIGADGVVLDALQDLTRLAVQVRTGERTRLMLEIGDFRKKRTDGLTKLASIAVEKVQQSGLPEDLEPMNAFERKVVHDYVSAAGLSSESHGADPYRYVTVNPVQ